MGSKPKVKRSTSVRLRKSNMDWSKHLGGGTTNLTLSCWVMNTFELHLITICMWKYCLIHVDDILIVGYNTSKIEKLKKELNKPFAMKDLGHEKKFITWIILIIGRT